MESSVILRALENLQELLHSSVPFGFLDDEQRNAVKGYVADILGLVDPTKPYGTKLFDALARVTISVACEACAVRRNLETGELEVFWRKRALDDTAYPGEWHFPGSVMRPGEKEEDVFHRLERNEFGTKIVETTFITVFNGMDEERGHFYTPVYLVQLGENANQTETKGWFPVSNLPKPAVGHHLHRLLPLMIEAFERQEKASLSI